MEKILCLLWVFIMLFYSYSLNVEGRHHISKKPKSKSVISYAPSPVEASVNQPSPPPSLASSPSNVVPSDPSYGGGPSLNPDDCVFDVTEYGAVGDGSTDDTDAFVAAWKAACQVESAVLLAPADRTFMITSTIFSGPCKPGLEFRVNGVLMPPEGPDCWPKEDSNKQWLVFYRLDNMSFTGTGTIEGNGEQWWELPCKPHRGPNGSTLPGPCDSPTMIRFFMSSNLVVRGLKIQNSPMFHMKFDGCEGVLIDQLSISSPKLSPNTDGIHIENTKSVGIYNSVIANGTKTNP